MFSLQHKNNKVRLLQCEIPDSKSKVTCDMRVSIPTLLYYIIETIILKQFQ